MKFLLVILAIPTLLVGKIIETNRMSDLYQYVDQSTWVLFDIDRTLIEPAQQLGSVEWGEIYLKDKFLKLGYSEQKAIELAERQWNHAQRYLKIRLVDLEAPALITNLKGRGICMMALTARSGNAIQSTQKQLKEVGIAFEHPILPTRSIALDDEKPVVYEKGVIYASWRKDLALESFMSKMPLLPRKIVFIDDRLSQLQSVEQALVKWKIPFVGLHYTASNENFAEIEPDIVELQWAFFPTHLSDDQARSLLGSE